MIYLILVWMHFIADFILLSDKVAINKSKSFLYLAGHAVIYGLIFILISPLYAVVNSALHFMVDGVTSRLTSYLHSKGERHWFFVVVGLDQAVHITCLFLTYGWIFP